VVLAFELTKKYDVQNVFGYVNNLSLNLFLNLLPTDLPQRKKLMMMMTLTPLFLPKLTTCALYSKLLSWQSNQTILHLQQMTMLALRSSAKRTSFASSR
jgi:hypothetical protein